MSHLSAEATAYLPDELEREIFRLTAAVYPDSVTNLLQVSRCIQPWIEPITHQVIIYHHSKVTPTQLSLESFSRNAKYVRHLLIGGRDKDFNKALIHGIPLCSNLVDLAIWTRDVRGVLPYLESLRITRLSISFQTLFGPGRYKFTEGEDLLPVFAHITHMEVTNPCWADDCEGFAQLPNLTHLSILPEGGLDTLGYFLSECENLKVLAVAEEVDPEGWALWYPCHANSTWPHRDPRAVYFRVNCVEDWEEHARGGRGMWARAEEDVRERMKAIA